MSSRQFVKAWDKDPDAVLDYQWDWNDQWLAGDTIDSHTITAPDDLTVESSSEADGVVTAWISGGTAGSIHLVVCHVVTTGGREDDRSIQLTIVNR